MRLRMPAPGSACLLACLLLVATDANADRVVTYYYSDPQGTPLAMADANGNIISTQDSRPFGGATGAPSGNTVGYAGHVLDADSDLVYMQARYYDPEIGRFLSVDAIRGAPGEIARYSDYTYVGNNPMTLVDPDGNYQCTTKDCKEERAMVENLRHAQRQANGDLRGRLNRIVKALGKENDGGIKIYTSTDDPTKVGDADSPNQAVAVNLASVADTVGGRRKETERIFQAVAASILGHEVEHIVYGQERPQASDNGMEEFMNEYNSYTTEQGLHAQFELQSGLYHRKDSVPENWWRVVRASWNSTTYWCAGNPRCK